MIFQTYGMVETKTGTEINNGMETAGADVLLAIFGLLRKLQ